MKVIKYGEGYKPKRVVCESCASEIEYGADDVQTNSVYIKEDGGILMVSGHRKVSWNEDFMQVCKSGFECPVCRQWIVLETVEFPNDIIFK